jgi:hypothetical protein
MALRDNPHVKNISVTYEITGSRGNNVERVAHVQTDLLLDGFDARYDRPAVDSVVADAGDYIKSASGSVDRVSIRGV